jgi:hypothetical protein
MLKLLLSNPFRGIYRSDYSQISRFHFDYHSHIFLFVITFSTILISFCQSMLDQSSSAGSYHSPPSPTLTVQWEFAFSVVGGFSSDSIKISLIIYWWSDRDLVLSARMQWWVLYSPLRYRYICHELSGHGRSRPIKSRRLHLANESRWEYLSFSNR